MASFIGPTAYEDALNWVSEVGEKRDDRTGTGTLSVFGLRMEYGLHNSFPLISSKKVFFRGVIEELLWLLRGDTNVKSLQEKGVHIWDEWANQYGDLGPVYGKQWRAWPGTPEIHQRGMGYAIVTPEHDQIAEVVRQLKENPFSRRIIVNAWNVGQLDDMALPPCHVLFQFYVTGDGELDCQLYQRSGDMFLGIPFNIASYSALTVLLAHHCGLTPGRFIHVIGDAHIYLNHLDQVSEQLDRSPVKDLPKLAIREDADYEDLSHYKFEDFILTGYDPHPAIKAPVAV